MMTRRRGVHQAAVVLLFTCVFLFFRLRTPPFEQVLLDVRELDIGKFDPADGGCGGRGREVTAGEQRRDSNPEPPVDESFFANEPRSRFGFAMEPDLVKRRLLELDTCGIEAGTTRDAVLVHFVKSSLGNGQRRDAIRRTWSALRAIGASRHETVFVIGKGDDDGSLRREAEIYGDVLQLDLEERRDNLPLKVLAGMQWAADQLPAHFLYSSCDDDMVVNAFNLINYIRRVARWSGDDDERRPCYERMPVVCVYGLAAGDVPSRNPDSKWYVPRTDYSPDLWPTYCRGGAYMMPVAAAARLYAASSGAKLLQMDDVWVTGLMRQRVGDVDIVAAPYAERDATALYSYDQWVPLSAQLVRHLWGDIRNVRVDVIGEIEREWAGLLTTTNTSCHP